MCFKCKGTVIDIGLWFLIKPQNWSRSVRLWLALKVGAALGHSFKAIVSFEKTLVCGSRLLAGAGVTEEVFGAPADQTTPWCWLTCENMWKIEVPCISRRWRKISFRCERKTLAGSEIQRQLAAEGAENHRAPACPCALPATGCPKGAARWRRADVTEAAVPLVSLQRRI